MGPIVATPIGIKPSRSMALELALKWPADDTGQAMTTQKIVERAEAFRRFLENDYSAGAA